MIIVRYFIFFNKTYIVNINSRNVMKRYVSLMKGKCCNRLQQQTSDRGSSLLWAGINNFHTCCIATTVILLKLCIDVRQLGPAVNQMMPVVEANPILSLARNAQGISLACVLLKFCALWLWPCKLSHSSNYQCFPKGSIFVVIAKIVRIRNILTLDQAPLKFD